MDNTLSRQILLSILGLAFIIVAIVGVSYAVMIDSSDSVISNEAFIMNREENDIILDNVLPVSDSVGKTFDKYFDFDVVALVLADTTVEYEISLEKVLDNSTSLKNSEVKFYLEKLLSNNFTMVSEPKRFFEIGMDSALGTPSNNMIIYHGSFVNNTDKKRSFKESFRLRCWIDERTIINSYAKSFKTVVKIYSKAL